MCCSYRQLSQTCTNPFNIPDHERNGEVLPVTNFEREHFADFIGNAKVLCSFCRRHLSETLQGNLLNDYLFFIDILTRVARFHDEQQERNEPPIGANPGVQSQSQETTDPAAENNNSTAENPPSPPPPSPPPPSPPPSPPSRPPSPMNGIDMILAAAAYVDKVENQERQNGQASSS